MGSCTTYGRTSPLPRASVYLFLALIKQQSPFQQCFKVYRLKVPHKELCMFQQTAAAGKQQQSKCTQFAHVKLKRNILAFLRLSFLLENTDYLTHRNGNRNRQHTGGGQKYSNEASFFSLQGVIFAVSQNKIIHLRQLSAQRSSQHTKCYLAGLLQEGV